MSSPALLHVPVSDGSCRLIRQQDWDHRPSFLMWLDAHCEFDLRPRPGRSGALAAFARHFPLPRTAFWKGPLEHHAVVDQATGLLAADLKQLAKFDSQAADAALQTLGRLLSEHPALVHFAPVHRVFIESLWRQEKEFFGDLAGRWRAQSGPRNEAGKRIREDFQHLLDMNQMHQRMPDEADAVVAEAVQAKYPNGPDALSIRKGANRAQKAGVHRVVAVAMVGCPRHAAGNVHHAKPTDLRYAPRVDLSRVSGAMHRDVERVVVPAPASVSSHRR